MDEIIAITKEFPMKEDIAKESTVNHQRGEPPLLQHPERKHHRHHRCAVRRGVKHAFAVRRDVRHACRDSGGIINVSSRCSSSLLPRCPSFVPQGLLFRCFNHPHANSSVDSLFRITFLHRSMVNPNDFDLPSSQLRPGCVGAGLRGANPGAAPMELSSFACIHECILSSSRSHYLACVVTLRC